MSQVINTIYERRAVRKYKTTEVKKEQIDAVIAAGCMAPSALNSQDWKFYILTDRELIRHFGHEIGKLAFKEIGHMNLKDVIKSSLSFFHLSTIKNFIGTDDHVFHDAPVVIFITAPKADEWGGLNIGMCAQNIMLAAKAIGLDSCPVGFARFVMQVPDYPSLGIPGNEMVELAIIVGYGNEHPQPHERRKNNVHYITKAKAGV